MSRKRYQNVTDFPGYFLQNYWPVCAQNFFGIPLRYEDDFLLVFISYILLLPTVGGASNSLIVCADTTAPPLLEKPRAQPCLRLAGARRSTQDPKIPLWKTRFFEVLRTNAFPILCSLSVNYISLEVWKPMFLSNERVVGVIRQTTPQQQSVPVSLYSLPYDGTVQLLFLRTALVFNLQKLRWFTLREHSMGKALVRKTSKTLFFREGSRDLGIWPCLGLTNPGP